MVCRLYHSGLVNLGWPKDMVRSTKRTLAKSAVEAVRTHKRKTLPSSRLTPLPSLARSQWMWPSLLMLASVSTSSVVFREQRRVHRSRSSARACSQTSLCTRRAQFVTITSRGTAVCLLSVCLSVCLSVSATLLLWIDG